MLLLMLSKKLLRFFLVFILGAVALTQIIQPIHAQVESQPDSNTNLFDTQLNTTITVNSAGISRVKHEFTITNKTPTTFLSQYGLKISSDQLTNITVTSAGQDLKPEVVKIGAGQQSGPGQTSIGITFPDKIVGEDKRRQFIISYTNPDAALISGSVLEVTLPPQANPKDYSQFTITLITPDIFGGPVRTTPENKTFTVVGNQVYTTFRQDGVKGVFALFGSEQIFDLDINYHLNNSSNNLGITQIALPPDTSYQKMDYQLLDPPPQKMELDADGNWIATYHLPAATDTRVSLVATAYLTLEPNSNIPVTPPSPELLQPQEYWPVNQRRIQELTQQYSTPEAINQYVVETLKYNTQRALNRPERLGALAILDLTDQAVCQEYTDLFITLARAAGIHARRATGYAYSQNEDLRPLSLVEDVLHAWPEYYDPEQQRWVPIDPTWEDTTGGVDYFNQVDLNHIVFAINGRDSQTPYPAGSYKPLNSTEKTVEVAFGDSFIELEPEFEFKLQPKKILSLNTPGLYTLEVTNLTGQAHYQLLLKAETDHSQLNANLKDQKHITLLPFQTLEIPLKIESQAGFLPTDDTIHLTIHDQTQDFTITTSPPVSHYFQRQQLLMALAVVLVGGTLIAGSLLVLRRRR